MREIRRRTRRKFAPEEKIRIVLEGLYTATSREDKYKAKAFIDMFVQRFAKAVAVALALAIASLLEGFESVRYLSLITIPLVALWFFAARYAGRRFQELAGGS